MIVRETRGYCPCCKQETTFLAENFWLRDFYICTKCGSIPRQRALMKVLREFCPDLKKIRIHESSPSPEMIARMRSEADNYSFSYCYDDMPLGAILENGGTNENLERLTLPDESVDVFITQDVMEHICSPNKAFREIERVLSTGGVHIFTTPVHLFSDTRARGRLQNGKWINTLPAIYHGNPISGDGSLVTYDWGDDIVSFINASTCCTKTEVIQFPQTEENYNLGLEADFLQVFISRKCKVKKENEKMNFCSELCKNRKAQPNMGKEALILEYQQLMRQYESIVNSHCWKMTSPIRQTLDLIKRVLPHS